LPVGGSVTYYSYDPNGNCAKIFAANGATYFAYNGLNLMTSVVYRTGVVNYFWYDAKQRRYAIQESTGTTYFTYDNDGLCELLERNSAGSIVAEYARGYAPIQGIGDRTGARLITAQGTYYQYDASGLTGNILRMTNAQGTVTGSFEYNAWGLRLQNVPPPEGTRFGFSAPAWITPKDDPDNVLRWSPTRNYHAGIGRFLQRDQESSTLRDYSYASQNPTSNGDPNGSQVPPPPPPPPPPRPGLPYSCTRYQCDLDMAQAGMDQPDEQTHCQDCFDDLLGPLFGEIPDAREIAYTLCLGRPAIAALQQEAERRIAQWQQQHQHYPWWQFWHWFR
jgi:RHS repeat-associated protein